MFGGMTRQELLRLNRAEYQAVLNQRLIDCIIKSLPKTKQKETQKISKQIEKEMKEDKAYQNLLKECKDNPFASVF